MLGFILKLIAARFVKNNYKHIKNGIKNGSKYVYNRLYTTKNEKIYPSLSALPASRSLSTSW